LPFVGAGMAIVGAPELTAAVSNAGGVGLFCLGPGAPEMLADRIDSIRRLTSAPFGVDFIVEETGFGPATTETHVEVAMAKGVPLAVFFWNPPEEQWMSKLKRAGIKVWGTAYSVESARRLKALGADAVIVQSHEAGGHVKSGLGAMSLVPAVVDALERTPVIAAGGIADGRTAAAAFMLGAQAVCVGTRLLASLENQTEHNVAPLVPNLEPPLHAPPRQNDRPARRYWSRRGHKVTAILRHPDVAKARN
jgi:NAD(P)H-dependent flavin oxidoreductase YrpB (nitropropane dioxygenase family)